MQKLLAMALLLVGIDAVCPSDDQAKEERDESKTSINKIMLAVHRPRPDALVYKVKEGRATSEEQKKLLGYYEALAKFSPRRGDADGWKRKTEELIEATRRVIKREEKSRERLAKARDCRGCHSVHK